MAKFYEFFAGGGMANIGLGSKWTCLFANDFDNKKGQVYRQNLGSDVLKTCDVRKITTFDLPDYADLVWGSFPCQDLSLAGGGAGLKGDRSGTFWPFWNLMKNLIKDDRAPRMIVLENVCGTLTSHDGKDFSAICSALVNAGYRYGAVIVDAVLFVPHSRPRLFIIAVRADVDLPQKIYGEEASSTWHTRTLRTAYAKLDEKEKEKWIWWTIPEPHLRNSRFADLIEENPTSVVWHSPAETKKLLSMMSKINISKVEEAKKSGARTVGAIYKRTRRDEKGFKVQRAEIRFDDIAGCLRTPAGGSSRQLIMVIEGSVVKSRLISSRETARLMGLPEAYDLPDNYNEAYHLTGDGVVVPVVRYLAQNLFEPILAHLKISPRKAA